MLTSKEDYIKAIYELGGEKNIISNKKISKLLKISPPSVTEMIKKLVLDDYLEYVEYRGVILKDKGIELGKKVRKRHLLWEVFLVEKLEYKWDEVDEIAEKLEHVTDELLEKRLESFLNNPKYCPHGNPIYGHIETTLLNTNKLDRVKIIRVYDEKRALDLFSDLGFHLGDVFEILERDEDFTIDLDGKKIVIDDYLLDKIFIVRE